MIDTFEASLPNGITLSCRASGRPGAPVLLFLHGFPEAAFVWDELLGHFGSRYRCVAPNLRGFWPSSAPTDAAAYRLDHLMSDLDGLIDRIVPQAGAPLEALIAHDWGGAVAWAYAAAQPARMKRLVILNAPHAALFLRELRHNPAQQAASAYMNFLVRPDAERLLAENDFARLWAMFTGMGATDAAHPGGGWLTEAMRDRYRAVWRGGLGGACNYYRATPLRPPTGPDSAVLKIELPAAAVTVEVPTRVLWGGGDTALPATLVDGLAEYVPRLRLVRVPEATHWIVHERPARVAAEIEAALRE